MKTTGTHPDITIIYEDNHLLVVGKPAGLLSQEDRTGKSDLLTLCREYLKKEYDKPGNVFLGLLHRLDKPVSGVMIFAKTSKSASRISEQIRKRKIGKTYLTVVKGKPPENGFLNHYLLKDEKKNLVRVVDSGVKRAKHSQLIFQTLEQKNNLALLKIKLITGRAHQIRVQLSAENFPVWGDRKYGKAESSSIALHAYELKIEHPTLKKEMVFTAQPPNQKPWNRFQNKN